ncbi:MAG: UpxY family transcription antiterminator [Nitrospirae bacterium]|nr:MAG: UpxY family transcription antiterminator [Nitrospirota bacterium]
MPEDLTRETERPSFTTTDQSLGPDMGARKWYALWSKSHCEQLVCDQLAAKGFQVFLPKIEVWSRRNGGRHCISVPMFPGYLFLHHAMDLNSYIEVLKTRELVRVLGDGRDRLAVVPDAEIDAIQKVVQAHLPALPYPYLREGQRVRITKGPLAGVEGILVHTKPNKGLLVLSIELFQRSVAVEVDCTFTSAA